MKYAKLINGAIRYAPNPVRYDGNIIGNPPEAVWEALGYQPVTFTEPPAAEEGCVAVPGWVETPEAIMQTWTLEPEGDISDTDAIEILLGGAEA